MTLTYKIKKYNHICLMLNKFLDLLQHSLCGYCAGSGHHLGHFLHRMNGKKIPISDIRKWIDDPDHGLFHGMCTAVWIVSCLNDLNPVGHYSLRGYRQNLRDGIEHKHNQIISLALASSIFHDFARVTLGQDNHDGALRNYFEDLSQDTYTHANPDKITDLVRADRFELSRFDDWRDWMEKGKVDHKMAPYLDSFAPVRECLRRFSFWEGPWIQHGFEGKKGLKRKWYEWTETTVWPIQGSYLNSDSAGGWAAEVLLDPFGECQDHYQVVGSEPEPYFKRFVGMTTCSRIKKIQPFTNKDHLSGRSESSIDDWVFFFNGVSPLVEVWIERGLPILPYSIVKKWDSVRRKLIAMFIAERAEWSTDGR